MEDTKEIENAVGIIRADKFKAEKAAAAAKQGGEHLPEHMYEVWAL